MSTNPDITWTIAFGEGPRDIYRSVKAEVLPGITVQTCTRVNRPRPGRRQTWTERQGGRPSNSRIYFSVQNETILENLANRTSRPSRAWGKILREKVLPALGLVGKVRWDRHAGCSMCPCSPGFIFDGKVLRTTIPDSGGHTTDELTVLRLSKEDRRWGNYTPTEQVDLWVTVDFARYDIPETEDPDERARHTDAVLRSVAADPSLSPLVGGPEGQAALREDIEKFDREAAIQAGLAEMIGASS